MHGWKTKTRQTAAAAARGTRTMTSAPSPSPSSSTGSCQVSVNAGSEGDGEHARAIESALLKQRVHFSGRQAGRQAKAIASMRELSRVHFSGRQAGRQAALRSQGACPALPVLCNSQTECARVAAASQQQYWAIKKKYRDVILFFKVGARLEPNSATLAQAFLLGELLGKNHTQLHCSTSCIPICDAARPVL